MKRFLSVLLAACLLCAGGAVMSHAAVDITAQFTDLNFRAAVYDAIGKTTPAPIYDTDVAGVTNLDVNCRGIESLDGLQYFTGLLALDCSNTISTAIKENFEDKLDGKSSSLRGTPLDFGKGNQIISLPALPPGLQYLNCSDNLLESLPALPSSLERLRCNDNQLAALPTLPSSLTYLNCENNRLASMPALPFSLRTLFCGGNQLTELPALASELVILDCGNNQLAALPALPSGLWYLSCPGNQLKALPALPSGLTNLYCYGNQLTTLPTLPSSLHSLNCSNNQLTSLNVTGLTMYMLDCSYNDIARKTDVKGFTGTWDGESFIFAPQNVEVEPDPDPPVPHFWVSWPPFLVSILRYVLFGWLWMSWF